MLLLHLTDKLVKMSRKPIRVISNSKFNVWGAKALLATFWICSVVMIYLGYKLFELQNFFNPESYLELGICFLISSISLLIYLFKLRPLYFNKIALYDTFFIVYVGSKKKLLPYKHVKKIVNHGSFYQLKFLGGKDFFFNHRLERAEYLIELIAQVNSKPFKNKKVKELRDPLFHGSMKGARTKIFFGESRWFYIAQIAFILIFIVLTHLKQQHYAVFDFSNFVMSLGGRTLSIFLAVNFMALQIFILLCRREHKERMSSDVFDKRRDANYEMSLIKRINVFGLVIIGCYMFSSYHFDLNHMNVNKSLVFRNKEELKLIDGRFKCLQCNFSLEKGMKIVSNDDKLGVIIATAGEEVRINENTLTRKPASNRQVVPKSSIAVESIDGSVKIYSLDQVLGKVIR